MKFAADEMLGKLARWLRFMGLDVVHKSPFPDDELIEIARSEGRILLTRDRKILEKYGDKDGELQVIGVPEDLPFHQMVDIVVRFGIDPLESAFTRCAICNSKLIDRSKEEVAGRVPPFVFANVSEYRECPGCDSIFWAGSHRSRIERILNDVKAEAISPKS